LAVFVPAAAGAVLWMAWRGASSAAPGAGYLASGLRPVLFTLVALSAVAGAILATMAPRFDELDGQLRSLPVSGVEAFLGLNAVPLLVVCGVMGIPQFVFALRLFSETRTPTPIVFAALFFVAHLSSAVVGACAAEAIRCRCRTGRAWGALGAAVTSIVATAIAGRLGGLGSGWWLAGLLPVSRGSAPPVIVAVAGLVVSTTLAAWSWIVLGAEPSSGREKRDCLRSHAMGTTVTGVMGRWLALAATRSARTRRLVLLALLSGPVIFGTTRIVLGGDARLLFPLCVFVVLLLSTCVALALSADLAASQWLWRTAPMAPTGPGATWWIVVTVFGVVVALGAGAVPAAILGRSYLGFLLVLTLVACPLAAAIGRILPWDDHSPTRQLAAGGLEAVGVVAGFQAAVWMAGRLGTTVGLVVVGSAIVTATLLLSVHVRWRTS